MRRTIEKGCIPKFEEMIDFLYKTGKCLYMGDGKLEERSINS